MPLMLPNAFTLGIFSDCDGDLANASTIVHWRVRPATQRSRTKMILDRIESGPDEYVVIDVRYTDLAKNAEFFLQPRPGTDSALALGFMNVIIQEALRRGMGVVLDVRLRQAGRARGAVPASAWSRHRRGRADDIAGCAPSGTNGPVAFRRCWAPDACTGTPSIGPCRGGALQGCFRAPGRSGMPISVAFSAMLDDRITLWDPAARTLRADLFTFGNEDYPSTRCSAAQTTPLRVRGRHHRRAAPVKMMVFVANDPLLCCENATRVHEAITSPLVDTIVSKDFYFSPTTKLADLVLPTADWSERDTVDEELFGNLVISTERAVEPPGECWDDWKFFLEWGKRIKPEDWPWADEREMVLWRLKEFYGMDLTWDEYVQGAYFPLDDGSGSDGPVYKKYEKGMIRPDGQPGFNTPTGRIELWCDALARSAGRCPTTRACRDSRVPARAGEGVPAHPGDGASAVCVLPLGMDEHSRAAQAVPSPVRAHPSDDAAAQGHHRGAIG